MCCTLSYIQILDKYLNVDFLMHLSLKNLLWNTYLYFKCCWLKDKTFVIHYWSCQFNLKYCTDLLTKLLIKPKTMIFLSTLKIQSLLYHFLNTIICYGGKVLCIQLLCTKTKDKEFIWYRSNEV